MLIRIRGHHDGIKEYLEKGQKQDREFERNEMDERVILAGDLDLTNAIIQSMDTAAERYHTITLSFKEDEVSRATLEAIVRDFEAFMFSAYRKDEYAFYAEAHLPRLKSYADRKSGEPIERKVHVHIVVPKVNLLSGHKLDPFGMVDQQARFIDAFQEHANHRYGLASPKDNRRVEFTDASEMISRYKGDVFAGANRELKASILDALLSRQISRYEDFQALLAEYGETRTRNAGREGAYENVKPAGAAKGVNLKEYVFSREFIKLDDAGKLAVLESRAPAGYEEPGVPRETPAALLEALREWHGMRAREVKYLNSGNRRAYQAYRDATRDEQRATLAAREARFYQHHGGQHGREISTNGGDEWRQWRSVERPRGREPGGGGGGERAERTALEREHQALTRERLGRWRSGADRDFDTQFDRARPAPESLDRVRSLSGGGLDGHAARRQMLLPDHALLELGNEQADRAHPLRRPGDREREGLSHGPGAGDDWRTLAARMYAAYEAADPAGRARLAAAGASKFERKGFGTKDGNPMPREFGQGQRSMRIGDVSSMGDTPSISFEPHRDAVMPPRGVRSATGRGADTVRDQLARDLAEARSARHDVERNEFQEIKSTLDASRLLAALAHTHGLIVEKYEITKGRDGADRIRCGSRNLNVSDFLTREMNLAWRDAAQLLRDTYRAQTGRAPEHAPRRTPERDRWQEFQVWRTAYRQALRAEWTARRTLVEWQSASRRRPNAGARATYCARPTRRSAGRVIRWKSVVPIATEMNRTIQSASRKLIDKVETRGQENGAIWCGDHATAFTEIIIDTERITYRQGILNRRVSSVELFRIQDVTSVHPWWQRLFGIGTVVVMTSDSNNPVWRLAGMKDAEQLRNDLNQAAIALRDVKGIREVNMGRV